MPASPSPKKGLVRLAELPDATQSTDAGQLSNVPEPLLFASTDDTENCVWGTIAPGVFTVTPKKLNPTDPFAVAADPMPVSAHARTVRHSTAFIIVFKFSSGNRLVF